MNRRDLAAFLAGGFGLGALLRETVGAPQALAAGDNANDGTDIYHPQLQVAVAPGGLPQDFIPTVHGTVFRTACAAGSCKVAFIGDSIITLNPTAISETGTLQMILRRWLKVRNPKVAFTFGDFAIGSQTWATLNGIPTSFPAWYTTTTNNWLTYPQAFAPDLLFIEMGNNTFASPTLPIAIKAVLTTIAGWSKVPSIVLVNSRAPARLTELSSLPGSAVQLLDTIVTGFQRSLCRSPPIDSTHGVFDIANLPPLGLIDIAARFYQVAQGFDPRFPYGTAIYSSVALGATAGPTGLPCTTPYTLPLTLGGDFAVTIVIPSGATTTFPSAGFFLTLICGAEAPDTLTIFASAGNGIVFLFPGENTLAQTQFQGTYTAGSGDITITVECRGEYHLVTMNGSIICETAFPRFADAAFSPQISWSGTIPSGQLFNVTAYTSSKPLPVQSIATNTQLFGAYDGSLFTTKNGGGNGGLHPSELHLALIDDQMVASMNLCGT